MERHVDGRSAKRIFGEPLHDQLLDPSLKKGAWTEDEDARLYHCHATYGPGDPDRGR